MRSHQDELVEIATAIHNMVTLPAIFDYSVAVHELLDMPHKSSFSAHGPEGLGIEEVLGMIATHQQQLRNADEHGVARVVDLLKEVKACAEGFLAKKPGFDAKTVTDKFGRIADELVDQIREIPQYDGRQEQRMEQRAAAAAAQKGADLNRDEHKALLEADPLSVLMKVRAKMLEFQVVASPQRRAI